MQFGAKSPTSDGGPSPSFFQRLVLNGWEGSVTIHADGLLADTTIVESGDTTVDVVANGATAATVTLSSPKSPVADGGVDGGDAAASDAEGAEAAIDGAPA